MLAVTNHEHDITFIGNCDDGRIVHVASRSRSSNFRCEESGVEYISGDYGASIARRAGGSEML